MMDKKDKIESELIEPCNDKCSFCFLNYSNVLGKNSLFRDIRPKEIGKIIKGVHHQARTYDKGEIIFSSGEVFSNLIFIVNGAVVSEIIDFEGKVICIDELRSADTIAASFIFGDNNKLPISITATKETKVLIIPREDLVKLFKRNEQLLINYLNISANRAIHLSNKIKILGLNTIKGKIAHYLLSLLNDEESYEIVLPKTQSELSDLFGVARPSIGRVLREMDSEGLIRAKGKKVKIMDRKALSSLLK